MMSSLLSFQPLVESYLRNIPLPLAAYSFVNILIWQDFFLFECVEIDGHLCVFASDEAGTFLYFPPLAKTINPAVIDECFARMAQVNKGKGVTRVENVAEAHLAVVPAEKYQVRRKGCEYLYFRADLAGLKGNALKSKRHEVNHFVKQYQSEYRPFEISMTGECAALYEAWARQKLKILKDEMHMMMIEDNRIVHRRVFEACDALGLVGRVVKVAGKIVAYSFGYFLNKEIFCNLLEIADPAYRGAATFIFSRLCDDPVMREVKFINVMDDLVPENVNRAKMSFRPAVMLPSYIMSLKFA